MPFIPTKTLTYTALFTQGRRVSCDHCSTVFTYVWGGIVRGSTTGIPLVSPDEDLAPVAFKRLTGSLEKIAKEPHQGLGYCPACHRLQPWMARRSRWRSLAAGVFAGLIGGPVLSFLLTAVGLVTLDNMLAAMALMAPFVFVMWAAVALVRAIRREHLPDKVFPGSKTDAELAQWVAECRAKPTDPFLAWYAGVFRWPANKEIPVSLGLLNQAGDNFMPELATGRIRLDLAQDK
jgi:hypothetical protein